MEEIEFSRWLFEGRPRQGKNMLPDGLNWLCYFAGGSEGHHENSISCIFLEFPRQVDMKNVVKCYKQFFCYFNALKTHCDQSSFCYLVVYINVLNIQNTFATACLLQWTIKLQHIISTYLCTHMYDLETRFLLISYIHALKTYLCTQFQN